MKYKNEIKDLAKQVAGSLSFFEKFWIFFEKGGVYSLKSLVFRVVLKQYLVVK